MTNERDKPPFVIDEEIVERVASILWEKDYLEISLTTAKDLAREILVSTAKASRLGSGEDEIEVTKQN